MGQVVTATQGFCHAVNGGHIRVAEGDTGDSAAQHHAGAGVQRTVIHRIAEILGDKLDGVKRIGVRVGNGQLAGVGFHRVGHGVDTGGGHDVGRQTHQHGGVNQRYFRRGLGVEDVQLHMGLGICHHGERRYLTAGAGGGGNSDQRCDGTQQLVRAAPILHLAAVGQQRADSLGGVHGAAAAHGYQTINTCGLGGLIALDTVIISGVGNDLIVISIGNVGVSQTGLYITGQTGTDDTLIGHDHHMSSAQRLGAHTGFLDSAHTETNGGGE